jgi:DNA repair protein RadC
MAPQDFVLIKDLHSSNKPRERLIKNGPQSLSDIELLSILLNTGGNNISALTLASQILRDFKNFKELHQCDMEQLTSIKNVGLSKAATIKAACEIALRMQGVQEKEKVEITSPKDVYMATKNLFLGKNKEHLYIITLDTRNKIISTDLISVGTINETLVHPREVFRHSLIKNAVSIILIHNHPSGDSKPSKNDIAVTERLIKVGVNIGIAVVDHIIVADEEYTSLKTLKLIERR